MRGSLNKNITFKAMLAAGLIIISCCVHAFWYNKLLPYDLTLLKYTQHSGGIQDILHDLNNDGFPEIIHMEFYPDFDSPTIIQLFNQHMNIINQVNIFHSEAYYKNYAFLDYTKDGWDDLFIITREKDSVFLSGIDLVNEYFFLDKVKIMTKPDSALRDVWDTGARILGFFDEDDPSVVYSFLTGHSIYPRGIYKFSINDAIVTKKFESTAATGEQFYFLFDVDNDNRDEIIIFGSSFGNTENLKIVPKTNDMTSNIFVLNSDLELLWHNILGNKYSSIYGEVKIKGNEAYLSAILTEADDNVLPERLLFSVDGTLLTRKIINSTNPQLTYNTEIVDSTMIYSTETAIIIEDINGNIISKYDLSEPRLINKQLPANFPEHEIISVNDVSRLLLFDGNLNILAEYYPQNKFPGLIYSIFFGQLKNMNNPLVIINAGSESETLNFVRNYHSEVFLSFVFSLITIILSLNYLLPLSEKGLIYSKFFSFSLNASERAVVIFDSRNKKMFSNKGFDDLAARTEDIISAIQIPLKLDSYQLPEETIRTSECILRTSDKGDEKRIRVIHTPVFLFNRYKLANMIFLEDYTSMLIKERSQVWSHAIQKVAHEIKTPLSSINLNLKYIQNTLKKDDKLNPLLESDFSLIKNEVDRI
ncbi:MAG: hypothetical protein K9N07_10955 [Candidatus Cloacimonetes bacterium]|nr:hypothetical protein [Candidatus Cloacimonadota bacterium]